MFSHHFLYDVTIDNRQPVCLRQVITEGSLRNGLCKKKKQVSPKSNWPNGL